MMRESIVVLLTASAMVAQPLLFEDRVEGERAVARARYAFVLNATKAFDEAQPRAMFEQIVRRQERKERALKDVYGIVLDRSHLAEEFGRIQATTRAPEQWKAIQNALGFDRNRVEEIVCRPLVVDRILREKFDFDKNVHAAENRRAHAARSEFVARRRPKEASARWLQASSEKGDSVDGMMARAKSEASGSRVLSTTPTEATAETPLPIGPALSAVLDQELKRRGDVTTVLEDRSGFQVMRLVQREGKAFKVEAVRVAKRSLDEWLDEMPGDVAVRER